MNAVRYRCIVDPMIINCRRADANAISFALVMHHDVVVSAYVGGTNKDVIWRSIEYIEIRSMFDLLPNVMKITVPDYRMSLTKWAIRSRQRRKADVHGWHKTFWLPFVKDTMNTRSISMKILTTTHQPFCYVRHDDRSSVCVKKSQDRKMRWVQYSICATKGQGSHVQASIISICPVNRRRKMGW